MIDYTQDELKSLEEALLPVARKRTYTIGNNAARLVEALFYSEYDWAGCIEVLRNHYPGEIQANIREPLERSLEDVPLMISSVDPYVITVTKWRLEIGK